MLQNTFAATNRLRSHACDAAKLQWALIALLAAIPPSALGKTVIVAHRIDQSIENEEFTEFAGPVLNDASQVAFVGRIGTADPSSDTALFIGDGTSLTIFAREGVRVPGFQRTYDDFLAQESRTELAISDAGEVAFWARSISIPDPADDYWELILYWDGSMVRPATFTNFTAPDGNGAYESFNRRVGIAERGGVIFHAAIDVYDPYQGGSPGIFIRDTEVTGPTYRIIQAGDVEFPGSTSVGLCGIYGACGRTFAYNDYGQIAIFGFLEQPDGRTRILRDSVGAQPYAVGSELGNWDFSGLYMRGFSFQPSINNHSEVAFAASVGGGSFSTSPSVILRKGSAGVIGADQVALTDDPAPDGNGVLASMLRPIINDSSQVAFESTFWRTADPPNDDTGILLATSDVPAIVAREGNFAKGGGIFSDLSDPVFALNHAGLVAFQADLHGLPSNQRAIFISNATDTLQVVRTGTALLDSTIADVEFVGDNVRQRTGLNKHGQVTYRAVLQNGFEAVALYTPDVHWRAADFGEWETADNWTMGIQPAGVHDTFLNPPLPITVTGPETDASVNSLTVGPQAMDLVLQSEAQLQCNERFELSGDAGLILRIGDDSSASPSRIHVTGNVALDGYLEIDAENGFVPVPAQAFEVISTEGGLIHGQMQKGPATFPYEITRATNMITVTALPRAGDLRTLESFTTCMNGPGRMPDPHTTLTSGGCLAAFDSDDDDDVDLVDFALVQVFLSGA